MRRPCKNAVTCPQALTPILCAIIFCRCGAPLAAGTLPPTECSLFLNGLFVTKRLYQPGSQQLTAAIPHPSPPQPAQWHETFNARGELALGSDPRISVSGEARQIFYANAPALAQGSIEYYFSMGNPLNLPPMAVPFVIAAKGSVTATNQDPEWDYSEATALMRLGLYHVDAGTSEYYPTEGARVQAIAPVGDLEPHKDSFDFVDVYYYELDDIGVVRMQASGYVQRVHEDQTMVGGTFKAYVDPVIQIDPNFMVEVDGVQRPGSEVFPLVFSDGVLPIPEPSTFILLTMATLALLAYAWRRRQGR